MKTSGARSVRRRSSCFMLASVRCPVLRRLVVLALQLGVWVLVYAAVVDLPADAADEGSQEAECQDEQDGEQAVRCVPVHEPLHGECGGTVREDLRHQVGG